EGSVRRLRRGSSPCAFLLPYLATLPYAGTRRAARPSALRAGGDLGRGARTGVLDVGVEPADLLPEHVEGGLTGTIAVGLRRELDVASAAAEALQRGEQALALDRERARVVVGHAVDQEDRLVD